MRILIVSGNADHGALLKEALVEAGHEVASWLLSEKDLATTVKRDRPDAIIISTDQVGHEQLNQLHGITHVNPLPVVLFIQRHDRDAMRRAVQSGVSAYVVDGLQKPRVIPVLETALVRFCQLQALKRELAETHTRLNERKLIERAKGLLMQRRGLNEQAAYQILRRTAMEHNLKIAEVARTLLEWEEPK